MSDPAVKEEENFEELGDSGFELEIVDDVPAEEKPRRAEGAEPQVPDDNEIENYSEGVQKRIKQLRFEYHEEERRKKEALRLQDEAVNYAKTLQEENEKLRKTLEEGEGMLVNQAKTRVEAQLEQAKREYKEAYETGDPDAIIAAQEKLTTLNLEKNKVETYKVPKRVAPEPAPVMQQQQEQAPQVKEPDERTKAWANENPWFGDDSEMTGYAFGVHEKLVKQGLNPQTQADEYYKAIDESMRQRFPDKFDVQEVEEAPVRQTGSVVAPAQRSAKKPRKVQLTSTAVALAKRLGLTPEQYAAQLMKEQSNAR